MHLREAKRQGVKIAINTDSHNVSNLDYISYGVYTARRGWIEKSDVVNALDVKDFMKLVNTDKQRK